MTGLDLAIREEEVGVIVYFTSLLGKQEGRGIVGMAVVNDQRYKDVLFFWWVKDRKGSRTSRLTAMVD